MLRKIFNKAQKSSEAVVPPVTPTEPVVSWQSRLDAAQGDDTALLEVAMAAPSIDIKLAAVNNIASEDALRAAEHEFRKRDKRVHSLAKQRHKLLVDTRQTRVHVSELIQAAIALKDETIIPANRLAELSTAWQQLPQQLIEDQDQATFAALQQELSAIMRERGEKKRAALRWSETASQLLAELGNICAEVANDTAISDDFSGRLASVRGRCNMTLAEQSIPEAEIKPEGDAIAALSAAMRTMLRESELILLRVELLAELRSSPSTPSGDNADTGPIKDISASVKLRWKDMPALADKHLARALNARLDELLHGARAAREAHDKELADKVSKQGKVAKQARMRSLAAHADELQSELDTGHIAEASKLLAELQKATAEGSTNPALQTRIAALQAEYSRLKGWQHWGGGRAREDLVGEAEALRATVALAAEGDGTKLPVKQLERDIVHLRERWKELDRLGGATSKPLWERFDVALKSAYAPVAEHLAQLKAVRLDNLHAREKLLAELDVPQITTADDDTTDWKAIARALAHFHTEWRKLGPLEHTTPRKAQASLVARYDSSVSRLEVPLRVVQDAARVKREHLIARAKALADDAHGRLTMATLRELQDQWQTQARSLPLPRKMENTLWSEFRGAIDQLTSLRAAAIDARDTELRSNQAAREALIAQLEKLHQDTPPADIKRTLAQIEEAWHSAGEAPRKNASALDERYRAARERVRGYMDGAAKRSWQRSCELVLEKLALCEAAESGAAPSSRENESTDGLRLPAMWQQALDSRYANAIRPGMGTVGDAAQLDQLLLQLEHTLDIPSPAELHSARHALKLQAMKVALEGHRTATTSWHEIETSVATALSLVAVSERQRTRLRAIVAVLQDSSLRPR